MTENQLYALIEKELRGELSPSEGQALRAWQAQGAENNTTYEEVRAVLELTSEGLNRIDPETEASWASVMRQIDSTPVVQMPVQSPRSTRRWWAVAAAVVLLGVVGFLTAPMWSGNSGSSQVFATDNGKVQRWLLSDQSQVTLNSGSQLALAEDFGKAERRMELEGEAFFEVTPNPEKPFVIGTGGAEIRVLGTSFNVSAYPGTDLVQVSVNSGKVAFSAKGETLYLVKGQSAVCRPSTGELSLDEEKVVEDALAWQEGQLVFKGTPLREVLVRLEKHYDLEISASEDLLDQRLTSRFNLNSHSVEEMLEILSGSLQCEYQHNGRRVTLVK